MSLNFDKISEKDSFSENMWSSYSDLFMMLSTVFLMLYVIASLRSGTETIYNKLEYQKLAMESDDLKEQNKVYNTLKDEQLEQTSENEQEVYKQLMSKLSLLKDEARKEKDNLRLQATENEKKEMALNQYQRIVRNIINANILAKAGLQQRDQVIEQKRKTIVQKEKTISEKNVEIQEQEKIITTTQKELEHKEQEVQNLKQDIAEKEEQIQNNNTKISAIKNALSNKISQLKSQKMSKEKLEKQINKFKEISENRINSLVAQNAKYEGDLGEVKSQLTDANQTLNKVKSELTDTASELAGAKTEITNKENETKQLSAKIVSAKEKLTNLGDKIKQSESDLAKTAKEKAKVEGELAQAAKDTEQYKKYIDDLQKEKASLTGDLEKSNNIINAKKKLAKAIDENFRKAGIKVDVDSQTGDVTLNFGGEYFETNRADLKDGMKHKIEEFIPIYSESLFKDEKIAKHIEGVEIVGFSSPTYKNRYVDPQSLSEDDRAAIDYNLDLSYERAKAIFKHTFDTRKMQFKNQKKLLPLVKVIGRSFLAEGVKGQKIDSSLTHKQYCEQYDCKKAQKVTIRFNLKD